MENNKIEAIIKKYEYDLLLKDLVQIQFSIII